MAELLDIVNEKSESTDEAESAREISPDVLLRLRQLGDAGLRAAMQKLKSE